MSRSRTSGKGQKKISAAADFIIAGEQAEFAHSTQAKEHKLCCAEQHAEHVKEMLQAKAESPQIDIDLQGRKFKNRDPIPTRPP